MKQTYIATSLRPFAISVRVISLEDVHRDLGATRPQNPSPDNPSLSHCYYTPFQS